jgi:SAM-dependent methyltransferase
MPEWFEQFDDRLWLKEDEGAEEDARLVRRMLHLRKGQRVLDAPCGAGRITVHLARAGLAVTGVDRNPRFLGRARGRFRREGLAGEFHEIDLRQLDIDSRFDAVVNWFGSFGYFSDEENLDLLRRFARALRPGGRLLVEHVNRERVLRHFLTRIVGPHGRAHGWGRLTVRNRWDSASERVEGRWLLEVRGRRLHCRSSLRFFTPGQLGELFERAGLRVEAMYDSVDASPFTRRSRRLAVVGVKASD